MSLALHPSELPAQDEALIASLRRPIGMGRGWGLVRTLLLSVASFGVLPLLAWPIRLRDLFAGEAARMMQVSTFATARDPDWPDRRDLLIAARRTGPRPTLWIMPIFAAVLFIVAVAQLIYLGIVRRPDDLIEFTYRAGQAFALDNPAGLSSWFFTIWSGLLLIGYFAHFAHVESHFSSVRRFLLRFNALLQSRGVAAIPLPERTIVPNLFWLAAGAVLAGCFSAWWAVPMVVAGSLQRRDAFAMHRDLRKALADRVNALSIAHSLPELRCSTPKCQAAIRPGSRFCPRCGSPVSPLSDNRGIWA